MNILLCCSAGMSTSLLVTKMEKSAKEQGSRLPNMGSVFCRGGQEMDKADVILLGPQVRFLLSKLKQAGTAKRHSSRYNQSDVLWFVQRGRSAQTSCYFDKRRIRI